MLWIEALATAMKASNCLRMWYRTLDHFILRFNQKYPQLIDFLYSHKHLLTLNYKGWPERPHGSSITFLPALKT
jgi:hypothetical protein